MKFKSHGQIYLIFLIAQFLLAGCNSNKSVDVSNIQLNIKIERFDKDLSSLTEKNLDTQLPVLKKKYGAFYDDFMQSMLSVGIPGDPVFSSNIKSVVNNPDFKALKDEVQAKYPDLQKKEDELTDAFRHIKYYYPDRKIPRVVSFFSGFTVQVPIGNDYIGIGLDMFLGADSKFYPALVQSIPLYISRRFTPENITPRVIETYVREELFPEPDHLKNLLERMIYNGKVLYFMKATMPQMPDSLIIGYTTKQQDWAANYEAGVWGYFLENDFLYESDYMKIQKFVSEAPFTPGIGERNESSPKLGIYVGWQIVKKYMEENNVTLQELMLETDNQKILSKSKYKPK